MPKFEIKSSSAEPVTTPAETPEVKTFINKVPAFWDIVPTETGVYCVSNITKETFEGSMEDFNKMIKG